MKSGFSKVPRSARFSLFLWVFRKIVVFWQVTAGLSGQDMSPSYLVFVCDPFSSKILA